MLIERRVELAEMFIQETGSLSRVSLYEKVRTFLTEELADMRSRCVNVVEEAVIPGHTVQAQSCAEIAEKIRKLPL